MSPRFCNNALTVHHICAEFYSLQSTFTFITSSLSWQKSKGGREGKRREGSLRIVRIPFYRVQKAFRNAAPCLQPQPVDRGADIHTTQHSNSGHLIPSLMFFTWSSNIIIARTYCYMTFHSWPSFVQLKTQGLILFV